VSIQDDDNHYIYMLMRTISVESQPTMKVNIHNQCLDLKLIDREYLSIGAICDRDPNLEVDTGNIMSVGFKSSLAAFEGILTYELQRKYAESGDQSESTYIRLFVAWKSESYKEFCVCVHLIGYDKKIDWNRIKLEEYYQRYTNQFSTYTGPIKDTWLIHDDTVLMTRLELDFTQRDGVLNIAISEGVKDDHTKKPVWIDLKR
jgi:hypothetical protein